MTRTAMSQPAGILFVGFVLLPCMVLVWPFLLIQMAWLLAKEMVDSYEQMLKDERANAAPQP